MLSPFIAASLTYFFGIRSKRKDIDIEKEKELNTILSNLLNVWHYLTRLESVIEIISSKERKSLFPKRYLPGIILNTGFLNDECFRQLDTSIELLKKYDPITYYKLESLGKNLNLIRKQYIMPFFNNPKLSDEIVIGGTQPLLDETLNDIEENLEIVAKQINKKTLNNIVTFIDDYLDKDTDETLNELDQKYYEMMVQLMPPGMEKPSFEEFMEVADSEEFQQMQEVQMKIALEGKLSEALDIIVKNPNITTEELLNEINKATHSIL